MESNPIKYPNNNVILPCLHAKNVILSFSYHFPLAATPILLQSPRVAPSTTGQRTNTATATCHRATTTSHININTAKAFAIFIWLQFFFIYFSVTEYKNISKSIRQLYSLKQKASPNCIIDKFSETGTGVCETVNSGVGTIEELGNMSQRPKIGFNDGLYE